MKYPTSIFIALFLFFISSFTSIVFALPARQIAITIDDLPFVGEDKNFHLNMITETLKKNAVPATGFVIAKEVNADNWPMLKNFRDAGFGLGNHTYTHANLNRLNANGFIQEIEAADHELQPILTEPKFFRYPYLATSTGDKKEQVLHYLQSKHYEIAPVTIDSKDFVFNQLLMSVPQKERRSFMTVLKACYLDFLWEQTMMAMDKNPNEPQILLIHANLLNAYVLPDIIQLYRDNGFAFISLSEALKLPYPKALHNNDIPPGSMVAWD